MINLNDAVRQLRAKRQELLEQLEALDKALAALSGFDVTSTAEEPPQEAMEEAPGAGAVLPTRIKAPKTLSDEHKHALKEGRRKARHSKDAAAGFARELPEPASAPASASGADGGQPRLVKGKKQ